MHKVTKGIHMHKVRRGMTSTAISLRLSSSKRSKARSTVLVTRSSYSLRILHTRSSELSAPVVE